MELFLSATAADYLQQRQEGEMRLPGLKRKKKKKKGCEVANI